jgi:predicted GIY-YIG superfamily endonuclease
VYVGSSVNIERRIRKHFNGEKSPRAKLTNEIVLKIRKQWADKEYSCKELSLMYKIHERTVKKIIYRERWKQI